MRSRSCEAVEVAVAGRSCQPGWRAFCCLLVGAGLMGAPAAQDFVTLSREVDRLANEEHRETARQALLEAGPAAVAPLLRLVGRDSQPAVRAIAFEILGTLGPDALTALPQLLEFDGEFQRPEAKAYARALLRVWPYDPSFWSADVAELQNTMMRCVVRDARGYRSVHSAGVRAIRMIRELDLDPTDASKLIDKIRWVNRGDPVQEYIAAALARLGSEAAAAAPRLSAAIRFPVPKKPRPLPQMRYLPLAEAVLAIQATGPAAARAHAYLLIYHPDPKRRLGAAMALGRQASTGSAMADQVVWALTDADPRVVREAITALGMMGPEAAAVAPKLEPLLDHADRQIAARAKVALRQIQDR